MAMLVKHSNDCNTRHPNREISGIRELTEQTAPDPRLDFWELKRVELNSNQNVIEFVEKRRIPRLFGPHTSWQRRHQPQLAAAKRGLSFYRTSTSQLISNFTTNFFRGTSF